MKDRVTIGLLAVFGIILAALLVGVRLEFGWAGGEGYTLQQPVSVHMDGARIILKRGETIRTKAGQRAKLQFNFAHQIWLDENTDLTVVENTSDRVIVHLGRGRLYADTHGEKDWAKQLVVKTNAVTATITSGALFVVNFDFLESVSVVPVETSVQIVVKTVQPITTATPMFIHETKPISISQSAFDANAAPDFMQFIHQ